VKVRLIDSFSSLQIVGRDRTLECDMAASEDSAVTASPCARPPLVTIAEDSDGTKVWFLEPSGRNTR